MSLQRGGQEFVAGARFSLLYGNIHRFLNDSLMMHDDGLFAFWPILQNDKEINKIWTNVKKVNGNWTIAKSAELTDFEEDWAPGEPVDAPNSDCAYMDKKLE